ncbi:MAG: hypothetical protein V1733_02415 [bacterium]
MAVVFQLPDNYQLLYQDILFGFHNDMVKSLRRTRQVDLKLLPSHKLLLQYDNPVEVLNRDIQFAGLILCGYNPERAPVGIWIDPEPGAG